MPDTYGTTDLMTAVYLMYQTKYGVLNFDHFDTTNPRACFYFSPADNALIYVDDLAKTGTSVDLFGINKAYEMCKRLINEYKRQNQWK